MGSEEWLPIPRLWGLYEVSNWGRVRSMRYGRVLIMRQQANKISGHLTVCLPPRDGEPRTSRNNKHTHVHRLVMEAFVGPREGKQVVRHLDGNPANNRLENLTYGSTSENWADFRRHVGERAVETYVAEIEALKARLARCTCGC